MHTKTSTLTVVSFPLLAVLVTPPAAAQQPQLAAEARPDAAAAEQLESLQSSEGFQQLITSIVRDNIPHEFEERDGWGETKEVWDGLKIWRDGLQIKTKRRKKEVKHGSWKLYRVSLLDPERSFQIRIDNLRRLPQGRTQFDLHVDTRLEAFGRLAQWERGVQLIALSANAKARVQFRATCNLGAVLDTSSFPPGLALDPVVTDADLRLVDFRLVRISQLGGSIAHELGKALRRVLEDEVSKQRDELPAKINRQIEKNRDKLRFSIGDIVGSRWGDLASTYLGVDQDSDTQRAAEDIE